MSKNLIKWGGISAVAGGVLACLLTPVMSVGYYGAYAVASETPPFWFASVAPALKFLFAFADAQAAYATYGRLFAVVYLLFLPGVLALHAVHGEASSKLEKFGFVFLLTALFVAFVGVSLDYWGIRIGWSVELLAMLLLQIAATVYGLAVLRLKIIPRFLGVFLAAAIPLCVAAFMLVKQIPSAPTLPFAVFSLLAGVYLLRAGIEKDL